MRALILALVGTFALAATADAQTQRFTGTRYFDVAAITTLKLGGTTVTATAAELNAADVTAGTVTASKAAVVDASKDIGDFRNLDAVNLDAGASGTAGTVDIFPTTAASGKLAITSADNTGNTTTTIVNAEQGGARTYTIPDAGASASFVMTAGTQSVTGTTSFAILDADHIRVANNATLTAADVDLSKAQIQAAGFFPVNTTSNVVDVDFADDAALDAGDIGSRKTFAVITGGTNALTVTAGATGVTTVTTINTAGTSCEDVGDIIECIVTTVSTATCITKCADS